MAFTPMLRWIILSILACIIAVFVIGSIHIFINIGHKTAAKSELLYIGNKMRTFVFAYTREHGKPPPDLSEFFKTSLDYVPASIRESIHYSVIDGRWMLSFTHEGVQFYFMSGDSDGHLQEGEPDFSRKKMR